MVTDRLTAEAWRPPHSRRIMLPKAMLRQAVKRQPLVATVLGQVTFHSAGLLNLLFAASLSNGTTELTSVRADADWVEHTSEGAR